MFDGIPQRRFSSGSFARVSRPVIVATVFILLGMVLTVALPSDPSEGFHIEFVGP